MKKTTLRQVAFKLAFVALVLLAPLGLRAQQSLPYSYGFEDNNLSADGWVAQVSSSSGIYSEAAQQGSYGFRFYYSEQSGYLMSPIFTGNTSAVTVTFSYKEYSSSYGDEQFQVGYTTDETVTDPSAFTYSAVVTASLSWQDYEETFPAGTKRIAIKYIYNDAFYLYLDDFTFEAASNCIKPGEIVLGTPGATQCPISWTAGGTETSWNVYLTQGGSPVDGYNPLVVNTSSCTFTGLTAGTTYDVAIEAICGSDVSNQRTNSFTTALCEAADQCEITIVLTDSYGDGWNGNKLQVVDVTTSIVLGEYTFSSGSSSDPIPLSVCNGQDINFVYVASGNYGTENGWTITDANDEVITERTGCNSGCTPTAGIQATYTPSCAPITCPKPTNLAVDNNSITAHEAVLSWTENGSATQWQICLDGDEENLILVNTNPYTLQTLTQEHNYTAKVRAYCAADDQSLWSNEISFSTLVACPAPTDLTADDITATSATLGWTSTASNFNVRYRTASEPNVLFFDDFENGLSQWTIIRNGEGTEYTDWRQFDGNFSGNPVTPHSGTYMVMSRSWSSSAYNVDNWLITPQVTLDGTLRFWVIDDGNYHEHYDVYVSTTGNTIADFGTTPFYVPGDASGTWTEITVDLSSFAGAQGYIALRHTDNDQDYLMVDDFGIYGDPTPAGAWTTTTATTNSLPISGLDEQTTYDFEVQADCGGGEESIWVASTFTTLPSCMPVSDLASGETTSNTIELTWTDNNGGSATYVVTDADDNDVDIRDPHATGCTVTGLDANTAYTFKVKAECGDGFSTAEIVQARTACEPLDNYPYVEDFEGNGVYCWTLDGFTAINGAPNSGVVSIYAQGSNTDPQYVVFPETDRDLSELMISFWYNNYNANDAGILYVGYLEDAEDITTFQEVESIDMSEGTTEYVQTRDYTFDEGSRIALKYEGAGTTNSYVIIDDITISERASCMAPYDLAYSEVTAHEATLSWTAGEHETEWQIFKTDRSNEEPDDHSDGEDADRNPYTLDRLNPETTYYVWVRAKCGDDDFSHWVGPVSFTTAIACPAPENLAAENITGHTADLTWEGTSGTYNVLVFHNEVNGTYFSEDFATEIPTDWTNDEPYPWTIVDNHMQSGNAGQSNSSSTISVTYNLATDGRLEFDAECRGEGTTSSWDKCIFYIDGTAQFTYGAQLTSSGFLHYSFDIEAGEHTFTWSYTKDNSVDAAGDYFAVDNIVLYRLNNAEDVNISVNTNSATVTGLDPETTYQARVKSICGEDGTSDWSNTVTFTTAIACMAPTTLAAGTPGPNQVDLTWTKTGAETAWQICLNGDETNLVEVAESGVTIENTTVTYTLTDLDAETEYTVKVRANCGNEDGTSAWSNQVSFTTAADCPVPVLAAEGITNISGHAADVAWTGFSQNDSYVVNYRTAEYIDGIEETFDTDPTDWTKTTGTLNADGTATLSGTYSWSTGTNNNVFDRHAYMNLYSTKDYWYITPSMTINAGNALSFDIAYTGYSVADPNAGCTTHRFAVLISTDNMGTWTILREWNNSGSAYVLDDVSPTGENTGAIDLSSYAGEAAYIAFYAHSETNSYDNNIHFDNVTIGATVPAGAWQTVNVTAPTTSTSLTGLDPETSYEVYVTGHCATGNVTTDASETRTFTTTVACPAPVLADVDPATITTTTATLTWTGSAATSFTVAYKADGETDFTEVQNVTGNSFTFADGTLTPATVYTVKVMADCGSVDGTSQWSNTKTFATECLAIAINTDGWTENFDSYTGVTSGTANNLPICWNYINTSTYSSYNGYPVVYNGTSYSNSGNNHLRFYSYFSTYSSYDPQPQYAILPEMSNLDNNMRIKLQARGYNATSTFKIGRMTDPTDASTFVPFTIGEGDEQALTTTYQEFTYNITGTGDYLAIMIDAATSSRTTNGVYIDDIRVEPIPSCIEPSGLQFVSSTTTTATLQWTAGGSETAWQIMLNDDEENLIMANTNPFTVEGLTAATTYTAKVRSYCNATDQSEWSTGVSFATECDVIVVDAEHPFTEDFEGTDFVPNCWDNVNSGSNAWTRSTYRQHSGSASAYSGYYGDIYLVMPEIQISNALTAPLLTFWSYNTYGTSYDKNSVVLLDGTNETELWSPSSVSASWEETTIDLTPYIGQTIRLAFKYEGDNAHGWYVDDVKIGEADHFDKTIEANKWYAISSPVHNDGVNETLAGVTNLLPATDEFAYDLFGYNEGEGKWVKPTTVLEQGKGYIYRRSDAATLTFNGNVNSGNTDVTVTASCGDAALNGFNLLGNPFNHAISYTNYYSLNEDGTWEAHTSGVVGVAEAFLVHYGAAADITIEDVNAGSGAKSTPESPLAITVSNDSYEDVAYAMFSDGEGLPKIGHLTAGAPMLSIPVEGRKYAIANLGNDCGSFELNLNGENGTYTLSVANSDLSSYYYLHLVDRATGADVDLLSQPVYTFTQTGGNAVSGRFLIKLTPSMDAEGAQGDFAYWNGSAWVVEGTGDLQVFDVLGRKIYAGTLTTANTQLSNGIFRTTGVYILHLGEKSQKIVVK